MKNPRYSISELHLGKFPDRVDFQRWKVNFKTELCANSLRPTITMPWIKEVEIARSIDDLLTSQSLEGKVFTDFEMLDGTVASALKNSISKPHFRSGVSVEEQRAQKQIRFLRGRRIAYMIFDHFRASSVYDAAQDH